MSEYRSEIDHFPNLPVGALVAWTHDTTLDTSIGQIDAHLAVLNLPNGDRALTATLRHNGKSVTTGTTGFGYGDSRMLVSYVLGNCIHGALGKVGEFHFTCSRTLLSEFESALSGTPNYRDEYRVFALEIAHDGRSVPVVEIVQRGSKHPLNVIIPADEDDWDEYGMSIASLLRAEGVRIDYAPSFT